MEAHTKVEIFVDIADRSGSGDGDEIHAACGMRESMRLDAHSIIFCLKI